MKHDSKKEQVLELIRKNVRIVPKFTALADWFEDMLKECNWYIYTEAPKGVKMR